MTGRPWSETALKPHGTAAAYRRHYRHSEMPCEACRRAMALAAAEYRKRLAEAAAEAAGGAS